MSQIQNLMITISLKSEARQVSREVQSLQINYPSDLQFSSMGLEFEVYMR